jgi:hypothetical protein
MRNPKSFVLVVFAALIFACLQTAALGQANNNNFANMTGGGSSVKWDVSVPYSVVTLTISAPDGRVFRREFRAGVSAEFSLSDRQVEKLPDGSYAYELVLAPVLTPAARDQLKAGRANDDDSETDRTARKHASVPTMVQSGSFSILNGAIIVGGGVEGQRSGAKVSERPRAAGVSSVDTIRLRNHRLSLRAMPDQVIPDDLIVQGSACIGLDCVNNESFGFDTIRLKENNTRIKFDDTSTSAGFPANDWQLTANDSASGGSSKFSIEDVTGSKVPFTITAGAATNSIFVDSTGRLGLRTSTPVLDLHVNTSNTPAIRLEQNNSGGFTAQTWDVAGNEANFFVRDVTGGSRLSFRIRPGAPTSSIDINASGFVGVGTASPTQQLHVLKGQNTNTIVLVANTTSGTAAQSDFRAQNDTGNLGQLGIYSSGTTAYGALAAGDVHVYANTTLDLMADSAGGVMKFATGGNTERMRILANGRVGIGTAVPDQLLSVNGDASKTGGNTWLAFSDERLKNIKGNFNSGLSAVMRLQPLRYEYKRDNAMGLKSDGEHIGFGAQSLQKIIPEAVTRNAEGYLMVNADPILWTMLNAIKEQQKEIAELKAEVQKLRAGSHRRRR